MRIRSIFDEFLFSFRVNVLLLGRKARTVLAGPLTQTTSALGRYPLKVSEAKKEAGHSDVGLCASCRFMRRIESDRGSLFYMCERSATDARFPKYPRLPVLGCVGYELDTDLEHDKQA